MNGMIHQLNLLSYVKEIRSLTSNDPAIKAIILLCKGGELDVIVNVSSEN